MKIAGVKFYNINSLKGFHEIRFDKPPFSEGGLFGITGPTGSGKTSILDAITIALFGRAHRHSAKDTCESITRHTNEAYSEVEFETAGKVYRARWSAKKIKNDEPTIKMELSHADTNEIIINHPVAEVKKTITELCGLDYSQFTRSVVLSQGDFAQFLLSKPKDRSELLEKITDAGVYSEISKFVFEKAKEFKDQNFYLQQRYKDNEPLPEEEIRVLANKIIELTNRENVLKQELTGLQAISTLLIAVNKINNNKTLLEKELYNAQTDYEQNKPLFERLSKHKAVIKYLPFLKELDINQQNCDSINIKQLKLKQQFKLVESSLAETSEKHNAAKELLKVSEKEKTEIEPVIAATDRLDIIITEKESPIKLKTAEIKKLEDALNRNEELINESSDLVINLSSKAENIKHTLELRKVDANIGEVLPSLQSKLDRLNELTAKHCNLKNNLKNVDNEITTNSDELNKLRAEAKIKSTDFKKTEAEISANKLSIALKTTDKTVEEIEKEISYLPELISVCKLQMQISQSITKLQAETNELSNKIIDSQAQRQKLFENIGISNDLLVKELEMLGVLRQNRDLQIKIKNYEADRNQLKDGDACPLCGSTEHPFANSHTLPDEVFEKIKRQELAVGSTQANISKLTNELSVCDAVLHSYSERKAGINDEIANQISDFNKNNKDLPAPLDYEKQSIITAVIANKTSVYEGLNCKLKEIRELDKALKASENQYAALKDALNHNEKEVLRHETIISGLQKTLVDLQKEVSICEKSVKEYENELGSLLSGYGLNYDNKTNIIEILAKRAAEYQTLQKELNEIGLQLHENKLRQENFENIRKNQQENLKIEKNILAEKVAELQKIINERKKLFGDKNTNQELLRIVEDYNNYFIIAENCKKISAEKAMEFEIISAEIRTYEQSFNEAATKLNETISVVNQKISEVNLASIDELRNAIMPEHEANSAEILKNSIEKRMTEAAKMFKTAEEELKAEGGKLPKDTTLEETESKIAEIESNITLTNREIGRIKEICDNNNQKEDKLKSVKEELSISSYNTVRWSKLSELIGSANGNKFRSIAQSLTLMRLTELANNHLAYITARYKIVKTPGENLDLQILDLYRADTVRPVSTLSGGESFLVSLALALALSELAGNKTQIKSLFIDEGFGSLDSDTLETAISALEQLKTGGKSIGIISHVDALKERIAVQIQVAKQPDGYGCIKILG